MQVQVAFMELIKGFLRKKILVQIILCKCMPQLKDQMSLWHILLAVYLIYLLQALDFLLFMVLGVDQIWLYLNLQKIFEKIKKSIYLIIEIKLEILSTLMIL